MIRIEVFHVVLEPAPRHVATLVSDRDSWSALDDAWEATQNIDSPWSQAHGQNGIEILPAPEVQKSIRYCRATTYGDYARIVDPTDRATYMRFTTAGHRDLTGCEDINLVGPAALEAALYLPP